MIQRVKRIAVLFVTGVLFAACSPRPAVKTAPADARAVYIQALIRRGCYTCLEAASTLAADSASIEAAFETTVLLALRSKELGLPASLWLERARGLVPVGSDWGVYLDIAMAAPADPLSGDRDQLLSEAAARRRPRPVLENWRRQLVTGSGSEMFRAYLDLSLVCNPILYDQRDAAIAAVVQMVADVPLLQYRAGICGETSQLKMVLQQNPEFADVHLELARAALQRERPDYDDALTRFRSARAAFPRSATISASIGNLHQEREEWAEALEAYDATLALVSSHRDSLLGKTISLSHLSRHNEAIESASRLLELGNWFTSDAYYWRAWNQYRLDLIPDARADIDRAKALTLTPGTLVLSGIIAWREKQLELAETEFEGALKLDFGQCEAASYLGGVRAERQRWIEGLAAFEHAEQCFELSIDARRKAVTELAAAGASPQAVSRQIASHERAIADAEMRRTEAARNILTIRRQIGVSAP